MPQERSGVDRGVVDGDAGEKLNDALLPPPHLLAKVASEVRHGDRNVVLLLEDRVPERRDLGLQGLLELVDGDSGPARRLRQDPLQALLEARALVALGLHQRRQLRLAVRHVLLQLHEQVPHLALEPADEPPEALSRPASATAVAASHDARSHLLEQGLLLRLCLQRLLQGGGTRQRVLAHGLDVVLAGEALAIDGGRDRVEPGRQRRCRR